MLERLRHRESPEVEELQFRPEGNAELGRHQLHIREFKLPDEVEASLSENQRAILTLLVRAARRTADLYALQEGKDKRANFYPPRVSRRAIEEAAQDDPAIFLSHYTIIRRTAEGKLEPIPMHLVYQRRLEKLNIPRLLREAANIAGRGRERDDALQAYLRAKAQSLLTGDYKAAEKIWLEREDEPKVDIVIGLYDTYTDRLFGVKYSWESWVGVLDEQLTHDSQWFMNEFLTWWQQETGKTSPKVRMRIDHTRIQAGQAAKYYWTGNSLPCQQEWRQQYGSKFTIFRPVFDDKFYNQSLPAFRDLIDPQIRMGASDNLIKVIRLRRHIAHETGHALGVAPDLEQRQKQFAAPLKELYCDLLALKGYSQIEGVSMRERELAFATAFSDGSVEYESFRSEGERAEYYVSSSIILNYCLRNGSVRIEDDRLTWDNPLDVFADIAMLFERVNKLQQEGGIKDSQDFFGQFFNPHVYQGLLRSETTVPDFLRRTLGNKEDRQQVPKDDIPAKIVSAS